MSDKAVERIVGLAALNAMKDEATRTEYQLILVVTEAVSGEGVEITEPSGTMDTTLQVQDNEGKEVHHDG